MSMSPTNSTAGGEALEWVIRMGEADADWDAFTVWLEADPANGDRYNRASSNMRDVELIVASLPATQVAAEPTQVAANDVDPQPGKVSRSFVRWAGAAALALVAGVVGLNLVDQTPASYVVATRAGEQRTVALADGSSLELAGGSSVRLDRDYVRVATVERGQILFRVKHDAAQPFAVTVGALRMVDLGTVFDVKITPKGAQIAVAEGAVMVDPGGAALRLDPGQMVVATGSTLRRSQILASDVGGWRDGRLVFDRATLEEVAADLSRQLGQPVRSRSAIAGQRFSGTLDARTLKGRPDVLGRLLGVRVQQDSGSWNLDANR